MNFNDDRAAEYRAAIADAEAAAAGFADLATHTLAAPAGSSDIYRAGWRVGFANVRNRQARAEGGHP